MLNNSLNSAFGINVMGYVSDEFGLGEACRSHIRAMQAADIPVAIQDFQEQSQLNLDNSYTGLLSKDRPYPISLLHANPYPQEVMDKISPDYFKGRYNIGFWGWELPTLHPDCQYAFDLFDEIWTYSNYCAEAISAVSPIPVIKVMPSITLSPAALGRKELNLPEDKFIFFFMFDFASIFECKNPLAIIKAFKRAFGTSNNQVLLLIKYQPHSLFGDREQEMKALAESCPSIRFIEKDLRKDELNALMYNCDSYISLHRAEAFGMTMAEAMFLGKPVIATAYSSNIDFMNVGNSFLVKYQLATTTENYGPYPAGSVWAEPDVDHAAYQMKYVVDNSYEAKQVGSRASEEIKSLLNPQAIGQKMRSRVEYIMSKIHTSTVKTRQEIQCEPDNQEGEVTAKKHTALQGQSEYDLTILSIFRQSEKYVYRYLQQVTEAFELNGGKCHAVWLEGDSTDNTYKILQQAKEKLEQTGNVDVTLIKFDNRGPYWGSIVNSDRWLQIATCWNKCIEGLKPSKITICVESDLIYNPAVIKPLVDKIDENHHVIYPMLMTYDGSYERTPEFEHFHDTWGMRRKNINFSNFPPYWPDSDELTEEEDLLEITRGGGMIVTTYEYQQRGQFETSCCIMKYPSDVKLFMHKGLRIYHPMPGEARYWTPSILLADWERAQLQVRQTRAEKIWLEAQVQAWKKTAQQTQMELARFQREALLTH